LIVVVVGVSAVVDIDTDPTVVDVSAFFLRCERDPTAGGTLQGAVVNNSAERVRVTLTATAESQTETYDDTFSLVLAAREERVVEVESGLTGGVVDCMLEVEGAEALNDG
jgi:hypothetical protein